MIGVRMRRDQIINFFIAPFSDKAYDPFAGLRFSGINQHGFSVRQLHKSGIALSHVKKADCKLAGSAGHNFFALRRPSRLLRNEIPKENVIQRQFVKNTS